MIRIAEIFNSLQGEGLHQGVPMTFVRFSGCSVVECPLHPARSGLCDTDWSNKEKLSVSEIMDRVPASMAWLSITGGEPTDQLNGLKELVTAARVRGLKVNLQTSGQHAVPNIFDWLTVSPKMNIADLNQSSGHELKLVYQGQSAAELRAWVWHTRFTHYYLQPLWQADGASNVEETAKAVMSCAELSLPWRLTLQSHKYAGIR